MKKLFVSIFAMTAISLSVAAQDTTTTKQDHKTPGSVYKSERLHRKDKLKELNLTEDQKKELKENRAAYKAKVTALEKDQSLTEAERNQKKAALRKEQRSNTQALLTPEQNSKMAEAKMKGREEAKAHAEKRMADLKATLSLSDEQVTQLKALDISNHQKMKAIRKDSSLDDAAKKKQADELKASADERRKSILTPDQLKKMDTLKKERKSNGSKKFKKQSS